MFNFIYSAIGSVLKFFSNFVGGNYLFGLLIFAILIKIVLLPFGIKQQKTSIRHAKLQPREQAIRKKYAGREDKATQQKMQQEIFEMYQQEGYNQFGGCLPMILQMVIILLLYQAIIYPLQHVVKMDASAVAALKTYMTTAVDQGGLGLALSGGYQEIAVLKEMIARGSEVLVPGFRTFCETFAQTAADGTVTTPFAANAVAFSDALSKAYESGLPNFDLFGIQNFLADTPNIKSLVTFPWTREVWLVLIPVLNFVTQFFSMKITKKMTFQPMQQNQQMGCMGKAMDWGMPAITLVIAFQVPAAIGIYWLFNNLLGMAQSVILHKAFPVPTFTEEDYKAAEKELKGNTKNEKLPKAVEGVRSNPNSLHTIDFEEEDYAVLPEYESVYDKTPEEKADAEQQTKTKLNGNEVGEPNSKIGAAPLKKQKSEKKKK